VAALTATNAAAQSTTSFSSVFLIETPERLGPREPPETKPIHEQMPTY